MPHFVGSLTSRAATAVCMTLGWVAGVAAQQPLSTLQFMPRFDFHLEGTPLRSGDPRFSWDTHVGGDFDLVDYVRGRVTLAADYQAVLGSEFRAFDPNQGNYTFVVSSSVRVGATEVFGVFHHVSRHLSDRPKRASIAWDDIGARVLHRFSVGGATVDFGAGAGRMLDRSFVDYSWTADGEIVVRRPVSSDLAVFGRAVGRTIGIDPALSTRGRQDGGRVEGGIRFVGRAAAVELFGGVEQVIDADPFDRLRLRWPFAGFRIISK